MPFYWGPSVTAFGLTCTTASEIGLLAEKARFFSGPVYLTSSAELWTFKTPDELNETRMIVLLQAQNKFDDTISPTCNKLTLADAIPRFA